MSEASQEIFSSQETEPLAKSRRKEQMNARKRLATPPNAAATREGADLLCDSMQLSNKQRLLSGFVGLAFLIPYTSLCLTYPEWTGHIGTRLNLALFSFLGQGALLVPPLLTYLALSCAGFRALRKTRYPFILPLLAALICLIQRWAHSGGWLGRLLDGSLTAAFGPGGSWLLTGSAVALLSLAFVPKAWEEMVQGLALAHEHVREQLLRWKERQLSAVEGDASTDSLEMVTSPRKALASSSATNLLDYSAPSPDGLAAKGDSETVFRPVYDSIEELEADLYEPYQAANVTVPLPDEDRARAPMPVIIDDSLETTSEAGVGAESSSDICPPTALEMPAPPTAPRLKEHQPTLATGSSAPAPQPTRDTPCSAPPLAPLPVAKEFSTVPAMTPAGLPALLDQHDPRAAIPRARPFELPPLALLDDVPFAERRPRVEDKSQALLDALDSFGVKAKLLQIVRGPTVTRYELLPARGVKVSKFTSLTNDIALALASTAVRIEAPIPGKSAIGIEIPNEVTDLVVIKDILRDTAFTESKGLTVALGKDLTGRPTVTDLQKMPHLLVAGTTGSGKSVCVNGLILSLLYRFTPDQLQLMMVDPKQVELSVYEDIPHLVGFSEGGKGEIIVDAKKAAQALHQVVELMEQRYTLFAECRVRNLAEYNAKAEVLLPWFVVIIDELADLMMVAAKSVETSICRIAQKARAAGIHLVLATQRPSADVITGLIKVNIPSRCAFAVSSQVDSRVILDSGGAENLLGKGDMLFLPVDASDPKRLQGAYVNNDEITRVVEFWKGQRLPENRIEFELKEDLLAMEDEETDEGSDDSLLEEGLRCILNRDQASASMLQTDLKVGYARARRLLMAMEKKGWVSPAEGSKPRKILYSGPLPEVAGDGV